MVFHLRPTDSCYCASGVIVLSNMSHLRPTDSCYCASGVIVLSNVSFEAN